MKKKTISWVYLGVIVIFVCICVLVSMSTSLWFFLALGEHVSSDYTLGYSNKAVGTFFGANTSSIQKSVVPADVSEYSSFVYRKNAQGEYLVGVPLLSRQFSIRQSLAASGWSTHRIGWLVVATKGGTGSVEIKKSLHAWRKTIRATFIDRLPLHPLAIAVVHPNNEEPFSLYVEKRGNAIHGTMSNSPLFIRGNRVRINKDSLGTEFTYVALQREDLRFIPKDFMMSIERKISDALLFRKTRPAIIEGLLSFGTLSLALKGEQVAVGVASSSTEPAALISGYIEAEQGTRHPVKRAFSLPDKTIGYEYIPGKSNAYFNLNKGKNNCLPSEGYDEQVFLCSKDQSAVLGTTSDIGENLLSFMGQGVLGEERGVIQGEGVRALRADTLFQQIEYVISDDGMEVWAALK